MEFLKNVVDYFDKHPGYELLMSFVALVFSTIPYIWGAFKKRFHLKATPIAFKIFSFNEDQDKNLAIQIAVTNLSETPCTITQAFLIVGDEEKYVSSVSENIFCVKARGKQTAEYYSLDLPQNLPPHQGISGCFIMPLFKEFCYIAAVYQCNIMTVGKYTVVILRDNFFHFHLLLSFLRQGFHQRNNPAALPCFAKSLRTVGESHFRFG